MSFIEARGLTRTYRRGDAVVEALVDVDLDVEPGEVVFCVGPSGSGKSTLLHLLGALDHPSDGRVRIDGRDLSELGDGARSAFRRERVGMIFQTFHLIPHLSALDNVLAPRLPRGISPDLRRRARELLERVGLGERLEHRPDELSGGECQRVAIARALLHEPALVLADEPTGELDTATGAGIMGLLRELVAERGTTLVIVTHDESLIEEGERVVRLLDGRVDEEAPQGRGPIPPK